MRKHLLITACFVMVTSVFAKTSEAASLNFDALAASTNLAGAPNNPGSVHSTDLNSFGIVFGLAGVSTGVAVIDNITGSFSDSNSITGLDAAGNITNALAGNMYFGFVLSGTLTPAVTNSVSFRIGDDGGDIDSWTINAYGAANALINTQALSGAAHQLYTLNLAGIARIEILNTSGSPAGFGVDDLTFNEPTGSAAAVPEPASLVLFVTGLAGLAARRLRRSRRDPA